jgi:hypothetical protein
MADGRNRGAVKTSVRWPGISKDLAGDCRPMTAQLAWRGFCAWFPPQCASKERVRCAI